jgi:uncharacterized protein (TIGR00255 family)
MTGFARVQTETAEFSLTLTLKSVNHRFLDVQVRTPPELDEFEPAARRLIRGKVARGHVQLSAQLEMRGTAEVRIERRLVEGYLAAYRKLAEEHGVSAEPDLNALFRLPGVVTWGDSGQEKADLEKVLLDSLARALDELTAMREREAAAIVAEMERRSQSIDSFLDGIGRLREGLTQLLAERLAKKLEDLLKGAALDPQRVLQEAALLAERSDVSEEIERLREHNRQLRTLLGSTGEVGKQLDFLLQEMNREANTLVSKTSGLGATGLEIAGPALALKAELETIREQGMTLE